MQEVKDISSSLALFWLGRQAGRENIPAFETCTAHVGWQALELPFILIPPYKPYLCFQQQITPDMFLESNMMDKNWRQKSSLMYCSFRVKHSIAKWWAATQELNVILCLKIKLQLIWITLENVGSHCNLLQNRSFSSCTPVRRKPSAQDYSVLCTCSPPRCGDLRICHILQCCTFCLD